MKAIVYTLPDCPLCKREIKRLQAEGIAVVERGMDDLREGKYQDMDALTDAGMQGWEAPLVRMVDASKE
jgi:glutaredoxin